MKPYPQRHAWVRKVGDEWTTTYAGGHFAPMTLHWTDHKIALQQALIWVGLNR